LSLPVTLDQLAPSLPPRARLMGVDLGSKTIGLAMSDVERRIASPLVTLRRQTFETDAASLLALVDTHQIAALIFGLPLELDGNTGPRAQSTRAFMRRLCTLRPLVLAFQDERFSTAVILRSLIEQDVSRSKREKIIDKMAAAYILQGALDRLSVLKPASEPVPEPGPYGAFL
jgi:putative holliday junction resolvase